MPRRNIWAILELDPQTADEKSVRRAYARLLRNTRPEDDPEAFMELRSAFDMAMEDVRWRRGHGTVGPGDADGQEPAPMRAAQPVNTWDETDRASPPIQDTAMAPPYEDPIGDLIDKIIDRMKQPWSTLERDGLARLLDDPCVDEFTAYEMLSARLRQRLHHETSDDTGRMFVPNWLELSNYSYLINHFGWLRTGRAGPGDGLDNWIYRVLQTLKARLQRRNEMQRQSGRAPAKDMSFPAILERWFGLLFLLICILGFSAYAVTISMLKS